MINLINKALRRVQDLRPLISRALSISICISVTIPIRETGNYEGKICCGLMMHAGSEHYVKSSKASFHFIEGRDVVESGSLLRHRDCVCVSLGCASG